MNNGIKPFLVLLIGFYLFMVFVVEYGSEAELDPNQVKVEQLIRENELLKSANLEQDSLLILQAQEKDSLISLLASNEIERTHLKKKRNEKMDSVTNMDNIELYGFFAGFKTERIND